MRGEYQAKIIEFERFKMSWFRKGEQNACIVSVAVFYGCVSNFFSWKTEFFLLLKSFSNSNYSPPGGDLGLPKPK